MYTQQPLFASIAQESEVETESPDPTLSMLILTSNRRPVAGLILAKNFSRCWAYSFVLIVYNIFLNVYFGIRNRGGGGHPVARGKAWQGVHIADTFDFRT
jgi:hypothetical protein